MSWKLKHKIDNFKGYSYHQWTDTIRLGYLVYYTADSLFVLDSDTLDVVYKDENLVKNASFFDYFVFDARIYFSIGNSLNYLDFDKNRMIEVCVTNENYIYMLNEKFCVGRTAQDPPRSSLITIKENKIIYNWEGWHMPVCVTKSSIGIFEYNESLLRGIDVNHGNELWSLELLGFSIPRYFRYVSDDLFLVMQCFDTDHPVDKRYELWGINTITGEVLYQLDVGIVRRLVPNNDGNLIGLRGQEYICVSPDGKIVASKFIDELKDLWPLIGHQSIEERDIYFNLFGKPLLGRFNIESQKVEEFIPIAIDESKVDMTQPLGTPLYHNEKLYVRDNSGVMHILERESDLLS